MNKRVLNVLGVIILACSSAFSQQGTEARVGVLNDNNELEDVTIGVLLSWRVTRKRRGEYLKLVPMKLAGGTPSPPPSCLTWRQGTHGFGFTQYPEAGDQGSGLPDPIQHQPNQSLPR